MKKTFTIIYAFLFFCFSLAAKDTFTAVFSKLDVDFNPHNTFTSAEAQLYTALYEGLLSYDPQTLEPVPGAAESWSISEDGLSYRFTLRKELKFSNGDPITSDHFRDSWLRLMSPESRNEYGSLLNIVKNGELYREGKIDSAQVGLIAESPRVFVVNLEQKAPQLTKVICHHSFAPIHPSLLENGYSEKTEIIANGPYSISENSEDQISFIKNENYWDKKNVSIGQLKIIFSDDPIENSLSFNRDDIDWLTDSFDLNTMNINEAVILNPLFSTTYLFFSNKNSIWQKPNVRKALALLLPWEEMRSSQLIPGASLIPTIPFYPSNSGIESQNIEEAFQLLKDEGFEKGVGLPPIKLRMPKSDSMSIISNLIKSNWENYLEVSVTIESEDFPYYYNSLKKDDYTLGTLTWIGDYADPMTFLEMWLKSSSLNDASYNNSVYDEKLRNSAVEDFEERYKIMSEAESILLDSAQVMPLGHSPALNIIDLRFIDGWFPNVLDIHPFKYLKFKSGFQIPGTA
jgi:peptide/nickel transport system substrate-binding protein/oligopeptide transport system substrate-binding protein